MISERWQQVKELFALALETEPSRRGAFLDQACTDDPALRSEVEDLLAADKEAGTAFLNKHPASVEFGIELSVSTSRIGRRIGPYQIIEEIGIGGMGEVYRAFRADDQYRKQVAIKLVRAGQDSKFVISRFKNERQVLASLDHPNIARLLEGGTTEDGVPYFVMELIEGQPITDYCDNHKLGTTERLNLFLQVCSAVQYAHQRLIIHRDLKPSNILVGSDEIPKLLDFGIAKILDPSAASEISEPTVSMFRLLTPSYASPEQIKGEPITTASDVYSLGVLLYELLTGRRPYDTASRAPHEIAQLVCECEPQRPSTVVWRTGTAEKANVTAASVSATRNTSPEKLKRRLRGDLDNIMLMALRKEPSRRYSSVEQLATDIRRHLSNLPVSASKDTVRYRASKFVRRHKTGVVATIAVAAALSFAMALTLREAHIARQQQLRAERRFNEVRVLANSLMFDIHDAIRDLPGATQVRKRLVDDALHYLDSLASEKSDDPSLKRELAAAYTRIGDVQGNPYNANLGDTVGALASYRKALAIWQSLPARSTRSAEDQRALSNAYSNVGIVQEAAGDPKDALINYESALATLRDPGTQDSSPDGQEQIAGLYWDIAFAKADMDDLDGALEQYQESATIREAILASNSKAYPRIQMRLAGTYAYMAGVFFQKADYDQAIRLQREALGIMKTLWDSAPTNAMYEEYYYEAVGEMGVYLERKGDHAQAQHDLQQGLSGIESLYKTDPNDVRLEQRIAEWDKRLGLLLVAHGQAPDGVLRLRKALSTLQDMSRRNPKQSDHYLPEIAEVYQALGRASSGVGTKDLRPQQQAIMQNQEACSAYQQSVTTWKQLKELRQLSPAENEKMAEASIAATHCQTR